jgi:phosphoribosylanthranilate isomerase
MSFPTIKICGMREAQKIKLSIDLGAKLIGFIVNYKPSPRCISFDQLKELTKTIPPHIKKVGVMVDPTLNEVKKLEEHCDTIQLHGDEKNEFIETIKKETKLEVIKAIKVKDQKDLDKMNDFKNANYLLLDTPAMGQEGEEFNFDLLKNIKHKNFFLAGKINIDNVTTALQYTDKIDVNSSLESEKGIKDPIKIKLFFEKIKNL